MDQLDPTAVIAMLGIRIYPGTEMERISLSQGIIDQDSNLILSLFLYLPSFGRKTGRHYPGESHGAKSWIVPGLEINITQNLMEQNTEIRIRGPCGNWWEG